MSIDARLWQNHQQLVQEFHVAIIKSMRGTWKRCAALNTTPEEPDFVAGLLLESTPLIYSALNSALSSQRISVSICAVFCHQTPKVKFGVMQSVSCELGDILFAYVHTPKQGPIRRNAILFQAKVSARTPYQVHAKEKTQLQLYVEWPNFEYMQSSFLTGQKRSVTPKAPHAGAQYLLIDDRPPSNPFSGLLGLPGTYPIGCCMADETLNDHSPLDAELFNMMIFRSGRPFEDEPTAAQKNDWSQVVWDIIKTGLQKAFNQKNSGYLRQPRSAGDALRMLDGKMFARTYLPSSYSTAAEILGEDGAHSLYETENRIQSGNGEPEGAMEKPEPGVSVVLIETAESESLE